MKIIHCFTVTLIPNLPNQKMFWVQARRSYYVQRPKK